MGNSQFSKSDSLPFEEEDQEVLTPSDTELLDWKEMIFDAEKKSMANSNTLII